MTAATGTLAPFFAPRGVAVVGASSGTGRAGGRVLAHLDRFGYGGAVYPVTRSSPELDGRRCYRSVTEIPDPVDLAVVAIGAAATPEVIRECGRRGIPAAIVFATGFGSGTPEGQRLQSELVEAHRDSGVRILGPNTLGMRSTPNGLYVTFAHDIEGGTLSGSTAVIAQSGGLGVYFGAAYLKRRLVGTRYLVDTGNEFDIGSAEVLEHIATDPDVSCVGLVLEGCRDGRRLARAVAAATSAGKPVVFFKVGRSRAAEGHISSHTGALASAAELFDSAMLDAGASVARDEAEFMDALVIHDAAKAPKGRRLGVVTPSGGYAILTIDAAEIAGMELPEPTVPPEPSEEPHLRSGALRNPYDWQSLGPPGPGTRAAAVSWMLRQPDADAVLLWEAYSMEMEERQHEIYAAVSSAVAQADKPLFVCGIGTPEFEARLKDIGVLMFPEPMRLVRSLGVVAPPAGPLRARPTAHASPHGGAAVSGAKARDLLRGIDHVETVVVPDGAGARDRCREWGSVFLKVEGDLILHRTEMRLVEGPLTEAEVEPAFERLSARLGQLGDPTAVIVAQRAVAGIELALGAYVDPTFGPAVMVASGGIFLEILRDARFALAPVTPDAAVALIRGLRGARLLEGARGRAPADVGAAARALVALSRSIVDLGDTYTSVDVNPLIVRGEGDGAVAVDALLIPRR